MKFSRKLLTVLCLLCLAVFAAEMVLPEAVSVVSTAEAAGIRLSKKKATVVEGETLKLKLKGTKQKAKWTSSNKKVATVSSTGKVKARKPGKAKITAEVGGKKYTCKVTVQPLMEAEKKKLTITEGESKPVKVTHRAHGTVTWYSSDESIVNCRWSGTWDGWTTELYINARKPGTATITIRESTKDKAVKIKVTVKADTKWNLDTSTKMMTKIKWTLQWLSDAEDDVVKYIRYGDAFYLTGAKQDLVKAGEDLKGCIDYAETKDDIPAEGGKTFKSLMKEAYNYYLAIDTDASATDLSTAIVELTTKCAEAFKPFTAYVGTLTN